MGQGASKDELLFQQVNYGNVEGIRSLRAQGAGLEFMDNEGKTPLIAACLRRDLLPVAKLLIDLGANVNAYRPGSHAGTPLHHAAKKGLEQTVQLLLSNGANPYVMNDDCHTALELAREKGFHNVVRTIESRISIFSGWLRELYGPSFLEALAPQLLSRKIWAVVLPCDSRNPTRPAKFELALYTDLQVAKPRSVISLWKANVEEPKFNQADPAVIIVEKNTRSRYKFLSAREGDKQQLQWFYNACLGIPQVYNSVPATTVAPLMPNHSNSYASTASTPTPPSNPEDLELAMAINASIQSAIAEGLPSVLPNNQANNANGWEGSSQSSTYNGWGPSDATTSSKISQTSVNEPNTHNGWAVPESRPNTNMPHLKAHSADDSVTLPAPVPPAAASAPSAPPITEDDMIHYPSIDSTPVDVSNLGMHVPTGAAPSQEGSSSGISRLETSATKADNSSLSSCCVICLDAPVEGACIPCGHMAGCMSCLKEIKAKHGECPICRTKINQVIKLYAV